MALTFDEACAAITGPDQPFALVDARIRGRDYKVFANAPATLPAMFEQAAARGDQDFLVFEDERWSFAEVVAHGHSLAARLVDDFGVSKGDRVAIAMRNYPEWVTSFVAVLCAGGVAVPLNAWWGTEELEYGLSDSGAKVIIADQERLERIAVRLADLEVRPIVVRCASSPAGAVRYDDLIDLDAAAPSVDLEPDDDATILYTSGTTGNSKGAVATHRSHTNALMGYWCRGTVDSMRAAAAKADAGVASDVGDAEPSIPSFILTVPLFHVTGCVPVMLGAFGLGTKLVMMYKWEPRRALQLVERERVTNFVGVPTMVQDVLECPDFDKYDTSSLKSVGGGGAPAAPELVRRVDASFSKGRPGIGYGMTETTAYGPQNAGDDYLAKPASAGRVVPVMQLKVIDEDGNEVATNTQGEICFYGPNLIRQYWNKPAETEEVFLDGWLRSGDIGRIDEDGYVFVEDRAKDVVIRAGENIGCIEVEAVISSHPSVYEVAVFGLPHQRLGEELACAVYLREGATLSDDELQDHVGEHLAAFKVPSVVVVSEEMLPRSAQGKILKRHIRDELTEQRAAQRSG